MVRRKSEMKTDSKCIRGGIGETEMRMVLNGEEEMYGKGRMFNVMTLNPGCTIGYHQHTADNEIFLFLSGSGEYNDNGTVITVNPGDAAICSNGEYHGLENKTNEPLVFVAVILY